MKTFNVMASLIGAWLAGASLPAAADIAGISYSGRLTSVNGAAFSEKETVTMTFRLYNQATGGDVLWGRRYRVLVKADGSFRAMLSYGNDGGVPVEGAQYENLPDALATGGPFYLGLVPNDREGTVEREFKPRQRLGAAVAAERAATAKSIDDVRANRIDAIGSATVLCQGPVTAGVCRVTRALELTGGVKAVYEPKGFGVLVVSNGTFSAGRDFFRFKTDLAVTQKFRGMAGDGWETTCWFENGRKATGNELAFAATDEDTFRSDSFLEEAYGSRIKYVDDWFYRRMPARLGSYFLQPGESVANSWNAQILGVNE